MLVRSPVLCQQTDFTFIYKYSDNKSKISSYSNLLSLNDSDFIYFEFSNELIITFGGNDDSSRSIQQFANCSNFQIYSSSQLSYEDIVKRPYLLDDQVLFNSNWIQYSSKSYEFNVKRKPNKNVKNCTNNLVITVYDSLHSNQNILNIFLNTNLTNKIPEKFYFDNVLGIMKLLFQYPSRFQRSFTSCKSIYMYLMKHRNLITKDIYFSLYDIFVEITNENLKIEWFEILLINIWLWSQSKHEDFIEILSHWSRIVVYSQQQMFKRKSYLSPLMSQFRLFFSDDDYVKQFKFEQCNGNDILRNLFMNFVGKVAYLHMTKNDIELFFNHLMSNPSKPTLLTLFKIFDMFTNENINSTDYFPHLLALLCDDEEINESVILAIHSMFENVNTSFSAMITAYERLRSIGKNKLNNSIERVQLTSNESLSSSSEKISFSNSSSNAKLANELNDSSSIELANELNDSSNTKLNNFLNNSYDRINSSSEQIDSILSQSFYNRLCLKLPSCPNLLPFLCLFALEIGQENEFASLLKNIKEEIAPVIIQNEFWYFLPIILGFNCDDEHCSSLCDFLVYTVTKSPKYKTEIQYIAIIICLLMFAIRETSYLRIFVNSFNLIDKSDYELVKTAVEICFNITFFHFYGKSYHDFVLDAFEQEGIKINLNEKEHTSFIDSVRSIDDIRKLAQMSYTAINLHFELRIDLAHKWKDSDYAAKAVNMLMSSAFQNETFSQVFQLFTDQRLIDSESNLRKLQFELDEIIQGQFEIYSAIVKSCFSSLIQRYIPNLFSYIHKNFIGTKTQLSKGKIEREQVVIKWIEDEILRTSDLNVTINQSNYLVPDLTNCMYFTPIKMKRSICEEKAIIPLSNRNKPDELYYEFNCKEINNRHEVNSKLKLYKSYIEINDRLIESNDLLLVVSRKKNNKESMAELFTQNGESFLLDFSPSDNSALFKSLQKVNYKTSIIQKGSPHSFFKSQFDYIQKWEKGLLSNYHFLCILNCIGGLSYHDESISPYFPLILDESNKPVNISMMNSPTTSPFNYLMRNDSKDINSTIEINEIDSKQFETIYQLRKLLETPEISSQLSIFIDYHFGYLLNPSKSLNFQLFKQKLNKKVIYKCPNKPSQMKLDLKTKISFSSFMSGDNSTFYFMNITSNGHELKILKLETTPQLKFEWKYSQTVEADENCTIYSGYHNNFIYFNRHFLQLFQYSKVSKCGPTLFTKAAKMLVCVLDKFLYTSTGYSVFVSPFHSNKHRIIYLSNEKIVQIVANSRFKVFSIATSNQNVSVISLNTGNLVNTVNVKSNIVNMIFTEQWSFLIVFTLESIVVMNVDGIVVKYCSDFNEFVEHCQTFSTLTGFDYVVYQNERNEIVLFEAFYPEKRKVLFEAESIMKSMKYDYTTSSLIFIFENGEIYTIPIAFD